MLSTLDSWEADRLIAEDVDDLDEYGLNDPSQTIKVTDEDGNTTIMLLGDYNTTTDSYYATVEGSGDVYTIASDNATTFQVTLDDLTATSTETEDQTSDSE